MSTKKNVAVNEVADIVEQSWLALLDTSQADAVEAIAKVGSVLPPELLRAIPSAVFFRQWAESDGNVISLVRAMQAAGFCDPTREYNSAESFVVCREIAKHIRERIAPGFIAKYGFLAFSPVYDESGQTPRDQYKAHVDSVRKAVAERLSARFPDELDEAIRIIQSYTRSIDRAQGNPREFTRLNWDVLKSRLKLRNFIQPCQGNLDFADDIAALLQLGL